MNQYVASFHEFINDRQGNPVIVQWPNIPAWLLIAVMAVRPFAPDVWRPSLDIVVIVFLTYWASLELKDGLSPFRQLLGLIGLVIAGTSLLSFTLSH